MRLARPQALRLVVLLLAAAAARPGLAGDEPPPRPFPDMPAILYFEDFELASTLCGNGTLSNARACAPGKFSFKLSPADKVFKMSGNVGRADFPHGINPAAIHMQFMAWTDDAGSFSVVFPCKGANYTARASAVAKSVNDNWTSVTVRLSDARADKKGSLPADAVITGFEIVFTPKAGSGGNIFVDNILFAAATPEQVWPYLRPKLVYRAEVFRVGARDGFDFTVRSAELLKAAVKGKRRKPKTAVVMGAQPAGGAGLIKSLDAAAARNKLSDFTFLPAVAPDGSAPGGFDDARTLLAYNVEKTEAAYAVVMLSAADAEKTSRDQGSVRAVLERTLETGCIPILCMPPNKVAGFNDPAARICGELGVPWVESAPTEQALEKAALAIAHADKHVQR